MHAHLIQMDIVWENRPANHATARDMIRSANPRPGDLAVLPELFDVGFTLDLDKAPDAHDETLRFLLDLADELKITIHGGRAIRPGPKALNHATITAPGPDGPRVLCEYAKIHPFSYGREGERFSGGDAIHTYEWTDGRDTLTVCPAVCYDLRFPELFRLGLKRGAQVFALGANWPAPRSHHWRALLIARAIENQAFVLGVNRCGSDPHLTYAGGAIAVGPKGEILGELGDQPGVLTVDLDPAALHAWRAEFPAIPDLRLI